MNPQSSRFNLNKFEVASAIAPVAIILVTASPLFAEVVTIDNFNEEVFYNTPANSSVIYTSPINNSINYGTSIPLPVNSSIIYGSPIPAPSITYPSNNFYSYPSSVITYPSNNFYSYPSYYPGVRDRGSVLINPKIRDSTLINPTIINIQPQRRYRGGERNRTIIRPWNY